MELKTIDEWLKERLTPSQYARAIERMKEQDCLSRLEELFSSFDKAIIRAFIWHFTKEGFLYWADLWKNKSKK